ncbi:MAG: 2-polyprenyl-3-methyl-6-methoxy-1,4-benzoquinone monooxygenase [Gammaproteobacteria bacterium]
MKTKGGASIDRLIAHLDARLRTLCAVDSPPLKRPSPALELPHAALEPTAAKLSGRLMRVNHTGEVCAQALYRGQAWTARTPERRSVLRAAAAEEVDHLVWCKERLSQLSDRPSYLNPAWRIGAFVIGAAVGSIGDRWNLGFLAETERQVVAHLRSHLERLPTTDLASRAIVTQMSRDEARHAAVAVQHGGVELPRSVRWIMRIQAKIMTTVAAIV